MLFQEFFHRREFCFPRSFRIQALIAIFHGNKGHVFFQLLELFHNTCRLIIENTTVILGMNNQYWGIYIIDPMI